MADESARSDATSDSAATAGDEQQQQQQQQQQTPDAGELGDAGKRALADLRRQNREVQTERDELAQRLRVIEDADKSELEKAQTTLGQHEQTIAARDARIVELEREMLARAAAADAGIPNHWARLRGASEDELKADAEALAVDMGRAATTSSSAELGAGARASGPATGHDGMNQLIRGTRRR